MATLADVFKNGALQQFGMYYGADGSEGPNTPYWQVIDPAKYQDGIQGRLAPYMAMTDAQLQAAWPTLPADLKAKLGATPTEFMQKVSFAPDGAGGWQNTFVEKSELMEKLLPLVMASVVGGGLGGFLDPFSVGGAGASGAGAAGSGLAAETAALTGSGTTAGAGAFGGAGAAAGAGATVGSDAWFEQLMQNFNPDLGFQGLNEAGSGLTGGMAGGASQIDLSNIDKMIENLGQNAFEAENLGTAASVTETNSWLQNLLPGLRGGLGSNAAGSGIASLLNTLGGGSGAAGTAGTAASTLGTLGTAAGAAAAAGGTDWLKTLLTGGAGLLQDYQKNEQSDKLYDLATRYEGYGAPSRARYEASYAPGFTMANDPGFQDALNQSAKGTMHALSASGGANPFGSPNAWGASLQDLFQKNAYPALQNYRNTNATAGGVGNSASVAPNIFGQAINAGSQVGAGTAGAVGSIFNPPSTLADLLKQLRG